MICSLPRANEASALAGGPRRSIEAGEGPYAVIAVERAMKIQDVILRAMSGALTWLQAADILGMHPRSLRRWRARQQRVGYDGLLERRRQRPSPRLAPFAEVERILRLYRERYAGFNVRHFHHRSGVSRSSGVLR